MDRCVADRAEGIKYAGFRCKTNACENDIKITEEGSLFLNDCPELFKDMMAAE